MSGPRGPTAVPLDLRVVERENPFPEHMCPKLDLRAIEYQYDVRLENLEEDFAALLTYCRELRKALLECRDILEHAHLSNRVLWLNTLLAQATDKEGI